MGAGGSLFVTVFLPFLAALAVPGLGRMFGRRLGTVLALVPLAILVLHLPRLATRVEAKGSIPWAPDLGLSLAFRIDSLALAFVLLIATVAAAVFPYAGAYLGADRRFFATLLAFMGAMLGIVLADDLILLFIFWELTSVTSFLLIAHHSERPEARRSAQQAFLVTFVGGLTLLAGALIIGHEAGTTRLTELPDTVRATPAYLAVVVCVLAAAFTKSAQVPFHFWLPNAMEAPTPVSALLHSATMVQAGVYLVARLDPFLGGTLLWTDALTYVGCVTAVLGGLLSLRQYDLKRLLAYSTVGALGLLIAAIGQRAWGAFYGFFIAHGLYKAAMFLVAGSLDHGGGSRDVRTLAGLGPKMAVTRGTAIAAGLSMAALPPALGYVGKEGLLHAASPLLIGATVIYGATSLAVAALVALRPFRKGVPPESAHEVAGGMRLGAAILAALGIALFPLAPALGRVFVGEPFALVAPGGWSLVTWAAGVGLYALWVARSPQGRPSTFSMDRLYDGVRRNGFTLAAFITRRVQHGYLNGYVRAVFGTLVVLVAYGIARALPTALPRELEAPTFYEFALAVTMIVGAGAAVVSASRLAAVAALGIVGYGVAVIYVRFGAPDLAMTQIAVETLTLILFVFTFYYLPKPQRRRNPGPRLRDGIVAGAVGVTMTVLTFIASAMQNDGKLNRFFSENALSEGKGRNVVNVILVDFRGFDTLGEITVLAVAGLGVFALLRMPKRERGGGPSAP
ncbi:MAG: hydrogen gas-evolving membrane-bound hydrogenase subunit E [Fimbriimonas sp.]